MLNDLVGLILHIVHQYRVTKYILQYHTKFELYEEKNIHGIIKRQILMDKQTGLASNYRILSGYQYYWINKLNCGNLGTNRLPKNY